MMFLDKIWNNPHKSQLTRSSFGFLAQDPEVWFAQIEFKFATHHITVSRMKFDYSVSSLSLKFATEVRDLLHLPKDIPCIQCFEA